MKRMKYAPCCSCYDFFGVMIPDYPISSHSILSCCINPSINFNFVSPVTFMFVLLILWTKQSNIRAHKYYVLICKAKGWKHYIYLPFVISLHLNLNTSNHPNEFSKAHLAGCSKSFSTNPGAGDMIQSSFLKNDWIINCFGSFIHSIHQAF